MARLRGQTSTVTTGPGTIVASTTAPASPSVGQRWYKPETAVTYQYTSDGATSFWLDITSDGIGTSATKSIDWAGNTDPLKNHSVTLSGLAVGDVYYNREGNRYFVCQDATSLKNRWAGRYVGLGGIQQTYISGTTTYVSHTFQETGTFYLDATQSCDILIVAGGGGGGGAGNDDTCGGGGGAGGVRELTAQSIAAGAHAIVVGMGGRGGFALQGYHREDGENSSFTATYVANGGGSGGSYNTVDIASDGGSGGGAANGGAYNNVGADNDSNSFGSAGGNGSGSANSSTSAAAGGGGGASTTAGTNSTSTAGGAGAAGRSNTWRTGAASIYGGGGGGAGISTRGVGGTGGGGIGSYGESSNTAQNGGNGEPFTGGGGGGATSRGNALTRNNGYTSNGTGGVGGSGIVVIRYAVN